MTITWGVILLTGVAAAVLARVAIGGRFVGYLSRALPGAAMGALLADWSGISLQLIPGFDVPFLTPVLFAAAGAYLLILISIVAVRRRR